MCKSVSSKNSLLKSESSGVGDLVLGRRPGASALPPGPCPCKGFVREDSSILPSSGASTPGVMSLQTSVEHLS